MASTYFELVTHFLFVSFKLSRECFLIAFVSKSFFISERFCTDLEFKLFKLDLFTKFNVSLLLTSLFCLEIFLMFGTAESLSLAFSLDDFVMGNRLLHLVIWFDFIFDLKAWLDFA